MKSQQSGFTLLELLIVVAIIGVLAAIAIPEFSGYRARAFNARAQNDLKNASVALEAYYTEQEEYAACQNDTCNEPTLPAFRHSDGVLINVEVATDGQSYTVEASHPQGSLTYSYDSDSGQLTYN